jgi:hypothetical protein
MACWHVVKVTSTLVLIHIFIPHSLYTAIQLRSAYNHHKHCLSTLSILCLSRFIEPSQHIMPSVEGRLFTQVVLFYYSRNHSSQHSYSPPIRLTSNGFDRISLTSTCENVAWWINGTFSFPPLFLRTPSSTYRTAYTCVQ